MLWFVVVAPVLVAEVFRSPMIDYRLVMVGAVLPLVELVSGRALVLHTLLGAVVGLTIVMVTTQGRRLVRRKWLGIPIGWFVHLVLSGTWTSRDLFWWPVFGFDFDQSSIETSRPVGVLVLLEVIGIVAAVWGVRRYGLTDPDRRARFVSTGQLDRSVLT